MIVGEAEPPQTGYICESIKSVNTMFNPAVTDGVQLFVWIVVILISFVGALSFVDQRKANSDKKDH